MSTEHISLYCVRADFGKYTKRFIDGNYVAIGWLPKDDLSSVQTREELYPLYRKEYPQDTSNVVIGQQVGQIARFLWELKSGDYVITPAQDTEYIYYGVIDENAYHYADGSDGCPYRHRKKVNWNKTPIQRYKLDAHIQTGVVKALRANIPSGGQGAFITTADFQKKATEIALEQGFPRIGLINGKQLVDILAEHWNDIPSEFQEKLDLKLGLVAN